MKHKWVLINADTGFYVKSTNSGISFTDDIEDAKIYSRQCDVTNSIDYWKNPYRRREVYKLIAKKIRYSIELEDYVEIC